MSEAISPFSVEEQIVIGEVVWVAIRARGAEWTWLTPAEAARLARRWVERYGRPHDGKPHDGRPTESKGVRKLIVAEASSLRTSYADTDCALTLWDASAGSVEISCALGTKAHSLCGSGTARDRSL